MKNVKCKIIKKDLYIHFNSTPVLRSANGGGFSILHFALHFWSHPFSLAVLAGKKPG